MNGVTPNKEMKARHDKIREIGCIVCRDEGRDETPTEIHHITGCKSQDDHARTIGLCYFHHRANQNEPQNDKYYTSRHPSKARFEDRYGSEWELLKKQNSYLNGE